MSYFAMSISELDQGFLAGFLEGEASFAVAERNAATSYSCLISVKVRDDEQDLIESLVALTGLGRLRRVPARATSRAQIQWLIDTQTECNELKQLISRVGFHGHRSAELAIWSEAVAAWVDDSGAGRRAALRDRKRRLEATRKFGKGARLAVPLPESHRLRLGYISGLVAAEGSFGLSGGRPRFSMHLRGDDRPLLELLASTTGVGRIYDHTPPAPVNPSSAWAVTARAQLERLLALLREADLSGRKRTEMETWAVAVDEICSAHRLGVKPRKWLLGLAGRKLHARRAYHAPTRPMLELPRRDMRIESLSALRSWAQATPGTLGAGSYAEWRREHASTPNRNTVARVFGSWHAAMEAAGLADRSRRSAPKRAGGEARRSAQRQAQRARVVAAVRQFEAEHGRQPRAMEFFKWRLAAAPAAPSQGTVYKLFPGGWAAVLEACRAS